MFKSLTNIEKLEYIFINVLMVGGGLLIFYPLFFMLKETASFSIYEIILPGLLAYAAAYGLAATSGQERRINYRWHKPVGGILFAVGIIFLLVFIVNSFYHPDFLTNMKFFFWGVFCTLFGSYLFRYKGKETNQRSNTLISWVILLGGSFFFIKNIFSTLARVDSLYICGFFLLFIGSLLQLKFYLKEKINKQQNPAD